MFIRFVLLIAIILFSMPSYSQLNMQFRSQLTYGVSNELANIGGYVDSTGREYALVGCQTGLSIVDVTNPAAPIQKALIPGTNSYWREVKVWGKYAYVTTEGGTNGLQIVNLGKLPGTITSADYKYWKGTGAINNLITKIHSLHIDNGYVYLNGSNLFGGACLIVSLTDPWNPVYSGNTQLAFTGTQRYVHDCFVRNDTLWGAHIYGGFFSIMNVSNKSTPALIGTGTVATPGAYTHNAWLSDAGARTLFTTDEVANSWLTSYNVTNPSNVTELDRIQLNPGSGAIVHNTHIKNNYAIVSWYKEGVAIVDVSRPDNMIITGSYDTYPQGTGNGFNGCWGVYPYLPSGNIVASDINNGLFVLTPTYVRGCYLEGNITDTCSGNGIPNATVTINNTIITKQGKLTGIYKTGVAIAGTYSVTFSKTGYQSKTITNVSLSNGVLTALNVQLKPLNAVGITTANVANVTCHGTSTGSITVSASGGGMPYNWNWSNGAQTKDIINLNAGSYTVTVTDAAGCTSQRQYTVQQPPALQVAFQEDKPSCSGNNDGKITAIITGGTPGYSSTWNPQRQSQIIYKGITAPGDTVVLDNIPAGNYILWVTDASGCNFDTSYTLNDTTVACNMTLNLQLFTEGFYRSYRTMTGVVDPMQPLYADTFYVHLAADTAGFPVMYSSVAVADTNGFASFQFPSSVTGSDFYIIVKHRNSIETWSSSPVPFTNSTVSYDFTWPASARPNRVRLSAPQH